MTPLSFGLLVAFVLAGCTGSQRPTPPAGPKPVIFRYVDVAPYRVIRLGEPFPPASPLGVEIRPGIYRLDRVDGTPVQLGDTRAILVALTKERQVCAFYFLYLPEKTFAARIAEYESDLGHPTTSTTDSADTVITIAAWQDSATVFHLRQAVLSADTVITAKLANVLEESSNRCAH